MVKIIRTESTNPDFSSLVEFLDKDIVKRDCENSKIFEKFNKIDDIKHVVIAYYNKNAIGCGALKAHNDKMEVKRMYVLPEHRGQGIATLILSELECWGYELSFKSCILQTGKNHFEAIKLYEKQGYKLIPNYGEYFDMENSVCFEKELY